MANYLLVLSSFLSLLIFDLLQMGKKYSLRIFFSIIGYSGIVSVILLNCLRTQIPPISTPLKLILIFFAFLFYLLLIYSLFIEINVSPYKHLHTRKVYDKGTYSISRHPGFLWLSLLLITVIFLYRNIDLTGIMLFILVMDLILVTIEDIFIFPKIFEDYNEYKKYTPFLLSFKVFYREKPR